MKSYPQIYSKVYEQPWLITPAKHRSIQRILNAHIDGNKSAAMEETDEPEIAYDGSTAIIPVNGVIGQHLSLLELQCGGCDVGVIGDMIDMAEADTNVTRIVFLINSPGGTSTGVPELGRKISACKKETIAFTDSQCCSGALWLAACCQRFYCTESSDVGSCGVYSVYLDESQALAQEGVKVNAISAGKYKLTGASFKPMTDDEKAMLQAGVDKIYAQFKSVVTRNREIADADLQGQVFDGEDAVMKGFCDGLVEDISEVLDN